MRMVKGDTYVVESPTNVGLILGDQVIMVDSFSNERNAKEFLREIHEDEIGVDHVINTHFHADHLQGNRIFQNRMGSRIWIKSVERGFVEHPELEGYYLFGAEPIKELRVSHFKAKPSKVNELEDFNSDLIEIVDLPGHSPGHVGVLTKDGVLFCGDVYFGREIIKKYIYPYHTDIEKAIESMEKLLKMKNVEFFVPSHGEVSSDPTKEIEMNRRMLENFMQSSLNFLRKPMTMEELMERLIDKFELNLNVGTYFLFRSFTSAMLKYLYERELILNTLVEGRMVWFERSSG